MKICKQVKLNFEKYAVKMKRWTDKKPMLTEIDVKI